MLRYLRMNSLFWNDEPVEFGGIKCAVGHVFVLFASTIFAPFGGNEFRFIDPDRVPFSMRLAVALYLRQL